MHHALRNLAKSKAALTAGRTAANAIYVPPSVQALLDLQSGVLHAEEKDYKTGYSYFVEAFEALTGLGDGALAGKALKYMLLCKVMTGSPEDVPSLASSKGGLAHQGAGLDAMVAVASASAARSLRLLQKALEDYEPQLAHDEVVASHLEASGDTLAVGGPTGDRERESERVVVMRSEAGQPTCRRCGSRAPHQALRDTLLERNLVRIIEPYSRVELSHVARLIELPLADVERKLGQMLLDKAFAGTLDQGQGCLLVYDAQPPDGAYKAALETIGAEGRGCDVMMGGKGVAAALRRGG